MSIDCLYVDLDGTLLGKGASLLHDGEGRHSTAAVQAVMRVQEAGGEVVIMSGRRKAQVAEGARLLGSDSYIYEVGAVVCVEGKEQYLTGELMPDTKSIYQQVADLGVPELLLSTYSGRLEYHAPWHLQREVSHLFRGLIDTQEVNQFLKNEGFGYLKLVDNGSVRRRSAKLASLEAVRAYHLLPTQASKASAVERHIQLRGYDPQRCLAVGDSREDLTVAAVIDNFWLVANALERDYGLGQQLAHYPNARVADKTHGDGVYQAVDQTLKLLA